MRWVILLLSLIFYFTAAAPASRSLPAAAAQLQHSTIRPLASAQSRRLHQASPALQPRPPVTSLASTIVQVVTADTPEARRFRAAAKHIALGGGAAGNASGPAASPAPAPVSGNGSFINLNDLCPAIK